MRNEIFALELEKIIYLNYEYEDGEVEETFGIFVK